MTGIQTNIRMNQQQGFSYVEMLVATVIVLASLGPAIDSLQSSQLAAELHGTESALQYQVMGRMEDVLAESFDSLTSAASIAGNPANPSTYSDLVGTQDRIIVSLSLYDVANQDSDNDFYTLFDSNTDGDFNPYTGSGAKIEMVWVRVAIPGTTHVVESLSRR